jgi:hypothetical protein
MPKVRLALLLSALIGHIPTGAAEPVALEALEIAPVWSGHPVGFSLLTRGDWQFAAFYDADRRMTVAARTLDSATWEFVVLPESVGWDSHNSIEMALDSKDRLHLSGNMHGVPLVYFRSEQPFDIGSIKRIPKMVGDLEDRVTYPRFFVGPENELIFTYRIGSSGNGNQIYNVYEPETETWKRLLDTPLVDGEGERNAYLHGPVKGPDGYYHLCWVWRDTPDCETNHDLSYARSKDLIVWERSSGEALKLPMTLTNSEVVDPVPAGGGILNGNTKIGFDTLGRVILSYHKNDSEGNTQIHNARLVDGTWEISQASDWDWRWDFTGRGSIGFGITHSNVRPGPEGRLVQTYNHKKYGSGGWVLDEETLRPVGEWNPPATYPEEWTRPRNDTPGMGVKWAGDSGSSGEEGVRYALRWETLGANRDRPREGPPPEPSRLYLLKIADR